jgi:hypothetical protein
MQHTQVTAANNLILPGHHKLNKTSSKASYRNHIATQEKIERKKFITKLNEHQDSHSQHQRYVTVRGEPQPPASYKFTKQPICIGSRLCYFGPPSPFSGSTTTTTTTYAKVTCQNSISTSQATVVHYCPVWLQRIELRIELAMENQMSQFNGIPS